MGGDFAGGAFSNDPQGTPNSPGQPSLLQSLIQGTAKGTLQGGGKSLQQQPGVPGGGGGMPGAPAAMPVAPGYFAPSPLPQAGAMPPGGQPSPFYSGGQ
jgi:hypothetical protein